MISFSGDTIAGVAGAASPLGIVAVVSVIAYLVAKDLAGAGDAPRSRLLADALNVAIIPVLFVLALIVIIDLVEVL